MASEVCRILGISTGNLSRDLDDDERQSLQLRGSGKPNVIISEPGLYSLILRSRKPEAKAVRRWVTHEVLPAIRKKGAYIAPGISLDQMKQLNACLAEAIGRVERA